MNRRLMAVLQLLSDSDGFTTVEQIAEATGAGVRTIHRDLETLERSLTLRGVRMERRRGQGVRLIDPLPKRLMKGAAALRSSSGSESGQRPLIILLYLILTGRRIKLSEIAHVLYVSDSTVSSDIAGLEEVLPEGVRIDRQKGTGVRIRADELVCRLIFLSAFPSLVPAYILSGSELAEGMIESGEERMIRLLKIRDEIPRYERAISRAEELLEYRFSPLSAGMLISYFFLIDRRVQQGKALDSFPQANLALPEIYLQAADSVLNHEPEWLSLAGIPEELQFLARLIAGCEFASSSPRPVDPYLQGIGSSVNMLIEKAITRIEERRRIWLHDDRQLLNYLRLTVAAAAHRIDLGISQWRELGLKPYPGMHDSPAAAAMVSEFLAQLGDRLSYPSPSIVRREILEASLALEAHIEESRSKHSEYLSVKVLCIEGLGMSAYLSSIVRDVLPENVVIDSQWDPDFEENQISGQFDLVVTTFPVQVLGARHVLVQGEATPDQIRAQIAAAAEDLLHHRQEKSESDRKEGTYPPPVRTADSPKLTLPVIMSVIGGFFVEQRDPGRSLLDQVVSALNQRQDCDTTLLLSDFQRRESYGSLIFEELNVRVLHCRTDGVPDPRAGVIQTPPMEPMVLVLAAPLNATQVETAPLSEIVIALTDYDDFIETLSLGSRREIQARLLSLFSQKFG